jgi:hypothetical protein
MIIINLLVIVRLMNFNVYLKTPAIIINLLVIVRKNLNQPNIESRKIIKEGFLSILF